MSFQDKNAANQEAWRRLLLQYQMRQKAAEEMHANEERERAKYEEEQANLRPGRYAHTGAALGGSIMPGWGHLAGAVLGKGYGAYEESQREGSGVGGFLKEMIDPRQTLKALFTDPSSQTAAIGAAGAGASALARGGTVTKSSTAQQQGLSAAQQQLLSTDDARKAAATNQFENDPNRPGGLRAKRFQFGAFGSKAPV